MTDSKCCAQVTRCVWFALSVIVLIMPAIVVAVLAAVLMQFLHWRASLHMLSGQQSDCLSVCLSIVICWSFARPSFRQSVRQSGCLPIWLLLLSCERFDFPAKRLCPLFYEFNQWRTWLTFTDCSDVISAIVSSPVGNVSQSASLVRTSNVTHFWVVINEHCTASCIF